MRMSVRSQGLALRLADIWGSVWRWTLMAAGTALGAYFLLDRGVQNGVLTAAVIGVLVIGGVLSFSKPMAIVLMSLPVLFISERLGLGGSGLSASDVALAAAFGTALLLGERPYSRPMRAMLMLNLVYQFATLFTVIINPFAANTVEWFHAWLLISGALVVGWSVARAGYGRLALNLMVGAALVIAAGTVVTALFQYAGGNFSEVYPAWPFPMHKNFAGTVMAFMAITLFVNPDWVRWTRPVRTSMFWVLLAAVVMTQSRQAIIGLVIAIMFVVLRKGVHGRSRFALLLLIPAGMLIATTVIDQVDSQNRFNSFYQRINWVKEVYAFWKHSPIFGHGLRYWYTDVDAPFQPPQAELEVAASAGIVGVIGFIAMWIGFFVVLWRIDPRFGTLAIAVIGSRFIQAQFDLFWVAGQVSIPFVIAGICLGAQALDRDLRRSPALASNLAPSARFTDVEPQGKAVSIGRS
jgi:O-antigen ligase